MIKINKKNSIFIISVILIIVAYVYFQTTKIDRFKFDQDYMLFDVMSSNGSANIIEEKIQEELLSELNNLEFRKISSKEIGETPILDNDYMLILLNYDEWNGVIFRNNTIIITISGEKSLLICELEESKFTYFIDKYFLNLSYK